MKKHLCLILAMFGLAALSIAADPVAKLEADGVIEPHDRVKVGARAGGIVDSLAIEEGALVKEGDVLAKLDDKIEFYEVERQASLVEFYGAKASKLELLVKEKAASQNDLDEATAYWKSTTAAWKSAQKKLADKTIRAPLGGYILRKFKQVGESVQEREDLFEMINADTVYFTAYFDAKDFPRVKIGQAATITLPDTKQMIAGKVERVDPAVDAGSNQFRLKVLLDNRDHRIIAGLKGHVTLSEEANAAIR